MVAKTKELHSNSSIYFCNSLFISFWRIYYNPHQFYLLHLSMLFHWTLVTFYFHIDRTELIVMLLWDCHHCSFIYTGVCTTPLYPCRYFLLYVDIKHLIDNFFLSVTVFTARDADNAEAYAQSPFFYAHLYADSCGLNPRMRLFLERIYVTITLSSFH